MDQSSVSVNYRHTGNEAQNIQTYTSIFLNTINLPTITLEREEALLHITEVLSSSLGLKIPCLY
jgi:hypothetical protein